jgi:hypothetical protein
MKSQDSTAGMGTKDDVKDDTRDGTKDDANARDGVAESSNDRADRGATTRTKQRMSKEEEERVTDQPADDEPLSGELSGEVSEAELRDFLAADSLEVEADPAYREGLRRKLWTMVSDRYGRGPVQKN